jgi:hypothetical protein
MCGLVWSGPLDRVAVHSLQFVDDEEVPDHRANVAFIAAARSDVPAMATEIEALRTALGQALDYCDGRIPLASIPAFDALRAMLPTS